MSNRMTTVCPQWLVSCRPANGRNGWKADTTLASALGRKLTLPQPLASLTSPGRKGIGAMPKISSTQQSTTAITLRVWGARFAALAIWFTGTYVLEWIGAPHWAYWAWIGALSFATIIGGNIL